MCMLPILLFSDSTDSTGSSTTSNRKEAPILKMPKSPRGNQKAASTDVSTSNFYNNFIRN